jgi:hypothetical protein
MPTISKFVQQIIPIINGGLVTNLLSDLVIIFFYKSEFKAGIA